MDLAISACIKLICVRLIEYAFHLNSGFSRQVQVFFAKSKMLAFYFLTISAPVSEKKKKKKKIKVEEEAAEAEEEEVAPETVSLGLTKFHTIVFASPRMNIECVYLFITCFFLQRESK